jgi:hypothetical protein
MDLQNAFNAFTRTVLFPLVRKHFPELAGYVEAAYGMTTSLFWGDVVIDSSSGVQQGDPLGPLLFALILADLWTTETRPPGQLDLAAFFLDDGLIAGDMALVTATLLWFEHEAGLRGLALNRNKSELILQPGVFLPASLQGFTVQAWDAWDILGCPIGSDAHVEAFMDAIMAKACTKCAQIQKLHDTHVGFTLLRFCASYCLSVYWQRTLGTFGALAPMWEAVLACFSAVCCPCPSDVEVLQLQLPLRFGGFGLRNPTTLADIAFVCSASASASLLAHISPSGLTLVPDPRLVTALRSPTLAAYTLTTAMVDYANSGRAKFGDKAQSRFSRQVEESMLASLIATHTARQDLRALSRLSSCQSEGASAYLAMMFVAQRDFNCWLPPDVFGMLCRRRLGLPVYPTSALCQLCGKVESDVFGHHTLRCMAFGEKTRAHHRLVDALFARTSSAMLLAQREVCPFEDDPGARPDILLLHAKPLPKAVDVAITDAIDVPASRSTPGGGATQYESVKQRRYGKLCAAAKYQLVPVVADTFGAWGAQAYPLFEEVSRGIARRFGGYYPAIRQLLLLELNIVLLRSMGRMLLMNSPACSDEIPGNRSLMNAQEAPGCRVEL